jgi:hypothetical protein
MSKYVLNSVKSFWTDFNITSAIAGALVALVAASYIN